MNEPVHPKSQEVKLSDSFWFNYRVIASMGFYPIDSRKNSRVKCIVHVFYSIIALTMYISFQAAELTYIIQNWGNITEMIRVLSPFIIKAISILKVYIFWKNSRGIKWLLDQLDGPGWKRNHPAVESLLHSIPVGSFLFAIQPLVFCFLWLITTYTNKSNEMHVKLWIPEVFMKSPSNHLILFFTMLLLGATGIAETAMDTMICGFMAHACSQLIILRESLQKIGYKSTKSQELVGHLENTSRKMDDKCNEYSIENKIKNTIGNGHNQSIRKRVFISDQCVQSNIGNTSMNSSEESLKKFHRSEKMKKEFVKCMNHHTIIVKFVKKIEEVFTWGIFFQFAAAAVIMCGCALHVRLVAMGSVDFFTSIVFTIGMSSELAIFCYFGDTIIFESSLLSEAIYHCRWTSTDVSFRRYVLIFMESTRVPISVSAGKFFQLSRQTFVNVLKTSYSYYALIKGIRSK